MWDIQSNKHICALAMLIALLFSNTGEAAVFGLFKRIDVQVSPEIKGFVTLHGEPQQGLVIKRGTFFDDSWSWDRTSTDADGHFYFAEKLVKARQVLYERQVALQLFAVDHPQKGAEELFFRMGASHNFKSPTRDLLTAGMHCELSADYTMSYLKFIESPSADWHGFESKCRFLHSDKVIVSQAELDSAELERRWTEVYQLLSDIKDSFQVLNTDQYAREDILSYAESGILILQIIPKLEVNPEKLEDIPKLQQEFQTYLDLLNKEE